MHLNLTVRISIIVCLFVLLCTSQVKELRAWWSWWMFSPPCRTWPDCVPCAAVPRHPLRWSCAPRALALTISSASQKDAPAEKPTHSASSLGPPTPSRRTLTFPTSPTSASWATPSAPLTTATRYGWALTRSTVGPT